MAELKFPPTQNGLQKTLDAQLNVGVTSQMTLNNTTGVQNKPGVVVIDRIDTSGAEKSSAVREYISYTGVSGNNLTGLTRGLGGSTDQDHAVGAIVEFIPDVTVFQAINDVITTEHNDDGTHKSATVTTLKASAAEITAGTEDAKVVTPKGLKDAGVVTEDGVQALTNKRITKRVSTVASASTHTINSDTTDVYIVTAQAEAVTFNAPTGTPTEGQTLIIRIKDNGTARAITWNAVFRASSDLALPTTTVANKVLYCGFVYNNTDSKWDLLALLGNF